MNKIYFCKYYYQSSGSSLKDYSPGHFILMKANKLVLGCPFSLDTVVVLFLDALSL